MAQTFTIDQSENGMTEDALKNFGVVMASSYSTPINHTTIDRYGSKMSAIESLSQTKSSWESL